VRAGHPPTTRFLGPAPFSSHILSGIDCSQYWDFEGTGNPRAHPPQFSVLGGPRIASFFYLGPSVTRVQHTLSLDGFQLGFLTGFEIQGCTGSTFDYLLVLFTLNVPQEARQIVQSRLVLGQVFVGFPLRVMFSACYYRFPPCCSRDSFRALRRDGKIEVPSFRRLRGPQPFAPIYTA